MGKKKGKASSKGKTDLWTRTGYAPGEPSAKEMHKKSYETKANLPEGAGTGRSYGSNKRLRKLMER